MSAAFLIRSGSVIVALAMALASFAPTWLWGAAPAALVSPLLALAAPLLAAGLALLPPSPPGAAVSRLAQALAPDRHAGLALWVLLAGLLLMCLPVDHFLFGDGALLVAHLRGTVTIDPEAYATGLLFDAAHVLLCRLGAPCDPWTTVRVVAWISAGAALGTWLLVARRLAVAPAAQGLALACLVLSGTALVYAGEPEVYAPLAALMTLSCGALVLWDGRHNRWLGVAGAAAALAFGYHPMGLIAIPGVLVAILWLRLPRLPRRPDLTRPWLWLAVLIGAALGAAVLRSHGSLTVFSGQTPGYTPFGGAHLRDLINVVLLAAPLQLWLAVAILWRGPAPLRQHPVTLALGATACAGLAAMAVMDPVMGALDWDLWTLPAIPVTVLAAWLGARGLGGRDQARMLPLLIAVAGLHLGSWIWLNADAGRATRVVETLAAEDAHHHGRRRAMLAARLTSLGQVEAAARQYEIVLRRDPRQPLALMNLGLLRYGQGRGQEAAPLLAGYVEVAPPSADTRLARGLLAAIEGNLDEAALWVATFLVEHPGNRHAAAAALELSARCESATSVMILQTARRCAAGELEGAVRDWISFAGRTQPSAPVIAFTEVLREQLPR